MSFGARFFTTNPFRWLIDHFLTTVFAALLLCGFVILNQYVTMFLS